MEGGGAGDSEGSEVAWAKAAWEVWGLGHVLEGQVYFT